MDVEKLSPEELLTLVKKSFEVPDDQFINMLPIYDLISKVADWDGVAGEEPKWLVDADEFFRSNFYNTSDFDKFGITQDEYDKLSISERASFHNLFGVLGNNNCLQDETEDKIIGYPFPNAGLSKYEPSPASIIETEYAADGSYLLRASCLKCNDKTELLPSRAAFTWCDNHNQSCK